MRIDELKLMLEQEQDDYNAIAACNGKGTAPKESNCNRIGTASQGSDPNGVNPAKGRKIHKGSGASSYRQPYPELDADQAPCPVLMRMLRGYAGNIPDYAYLPGVGYRYCGVVRDELTEYRARRAAGKDGCGERVRAGSIATAPASAGFGGKRMSADLQERRVRWIERLLRLNAADKP